MTSGGVTPESKKTKFGKVPDYHKARNELSGEDIGELVDDISEYEGDLYGSAQDVARAFYEEDPVKYNKNQMTVRETAKENVDKHSQPGWAWELLSVYSEDMGKKLLDVPSDGSHKGLLIDEDFEKVFLYAKDADGIPAVEHVDRWYENGINAQSLGYELPADEMERTALDIGRNDELGEPVLMMNYNGDMVLDSKINEMLEDVEEQIQDRNEWVKDSQPERRQHLEGKDVEDVEAWTTGLEFLIENDYIENWGVEEYKRGKDNTAVDPETLTRIMVDLGEFRETEDDDEDYDFSPRTTGIDDSPGMMLSKGSDDRPKGY
ncbi:hypothetical protein ACK3SF_00160 [Candidatus Nanosalina sp. VS9-1]|uniref:hypothetical protein n=1 Tax=Candidatus Nanosalina sp. VS9-1 TaxID=3388566 RepID=UPI0039E0C7E6